jgi:CxxC-x17-CxxC domain-containing protein
MSITDRQVRDTTVVCSQCGQEFTFTAGEQLSFARRGLREPGLCAFCRAARMIASSAQELSDGSEHRRQSDHDGRSTRGGQSGHVMYAAVCDRCGKQTKVPFEPNGYRPVYCSSCYEDQRRSSGGYSGGAQGRGERGRGTHGRSGYGG